MIQESSLLNNHNLEDLEVVRTMYVLWTYYVLLCATMYYYVLFMIFINYRTIEHLATIMNCMVPSFAGREADSNRSTQATGTFRTANFFSLKGCGCYVMLYYVVLSYKHIHIHIYIYIDNITYIRTYFVVWNSFKVNIMIIVCQKVGYQGCFCFLLNAI